MRDVTRMLCQRNVDSNSLQCVSALSFYLKGQLALIQDKHFVLYCFYILPFYVLLRITFCVIIIVSRSKDTTTFCKLKLHVLSQQNLAYNLA